MKAIDNSQPVIVQTFKPCVKVVINYERAGLSTPKPAQTAAPRAIGSTLDLTKLIAAAEARARVNALMGF